jgi:RNA processing factor Prp31
LKDSLGGNAYILLIACISNDDRHIEDSLRTLDFAKKVRNIKVSEIKRNETMCEGISAADKLKIVELEQRVKELETMLVDQA